MKHEACARHGHMKLLSASMFANYLRRPVSEGDDKQVLVELNEASQMWHWVHPWFAGSFWAVLAGGAVGDG